MIRSTRLHKTIFKNYYLSKFQKNDLFFTKDIKTCDIFVTGGAQNELFVKDLIAYSIILFGQRPHFTFKKQSRQNLLNQLIYFKTTFNSFGIISVFERIAQTILPHQENYLLKTLPGGGDAGKNFAIFFESCMTNEEIQYLPKTRTGNTVNHFNLSVNFHVTKEEINNLLFFFRFYYFPIK